MFCSLCNEEMTPLKGSICASGVDTCCIPCWSCHTCGNVSYLHNEKEFDLWISEYTEGIYVDPSENLGLFNDVDKDTLKLIDND